MHRPLSLQSDDHVDYLLVVSRRIKSDVFNTSIPFFPFFSPYLQHVFHPRDRSGALWCGLLSLMTDWSVHLSIHTTTQAMTGMLRMRGKFVFFLLAECFCFLVFLFLFCSPNVPGPRLFLGFSFILLHEYFFFVFYLSLLCLSV
ncbi:hypothetical protein J3E71DRAFT_36624 [Bipolaris maydis]|nr:hypothetical protein J3E71DRAFT_36624 [Bipolaris maydis]